MPKAQNLTLLPRKNSFPSNFPKKTHTHSHSHSHTMNFFFKPKHPSPPNHPQPPPPPPPHLLLQQAFSSLQTHFANFFQHQRTIPIKPQPFAKISNTITNTSNNSETPSISTTNNASKNSLAMSTEAIEERLTGVAVYALSNAAQEFVLVSGVNTQKNLGLFCFSEADAHTLLKQMQSMDPSMQNGSQVVAVALNKVFHLKVDGVAFRLIPEAEQVKHAVKERKKLGIPDESFAGVPVFQSKSLVLRSQNKRYRPVFFRKEDLDKSLMRASRQQKRMNPAFREGDIQVAVLEDIIKGMKDNSIWQWDDVVFIPPGFDVSTDPSQAQ